MQDSMGLGNAFMNGKFCCQVTSVHGCDPKTDGLIDSRNPVAIDVVERYALAKLGQSHSPVLECQRIEKIKQTAVKIIAFVQAFSQGGEAKFAVTHHSGHGCFAAQNRFHSHITHK